MALQLEIISSQRQQLGPGATIVLGASGGSIGRALDNDWTLPDPQRYLSGHHARFHSRQGHYYLEDTSTNGVFINDSATPQGRRGLYALHEGDVLRMGEYRIRVHIADESSHASPGTSTLAQMPVDNVVPLRRVPGEPDDLGASLNIEALIPPERLYPAARAKALPGDEPTPGASLATQQRRTRLRTAARARLDGNATPMPGIRNAMQAFCRGAGIDPARVPMENEAQSLHLMGRLLREAVMGLKEILRAQQSFRDRYGLDTGKSGHSPLEKGADEYLLELLAAHEQHQFDAIMQLRDYFTLAGGHDAALDPALRNALAQFMEHLSPTRLESGSGGTAVEDIWTRYRDIYGNLLQTTSDEKVPHLFLEAIAQSYPEALRKNRG